MWYEFSTASLRCVITNLCCLDRQVDELLCGVKMVLKATLPVLVQAEMEEAYGNLW